MGLVFVLVLTVAEASNVGFFVQPFPQVTDFVAVPSESVAHGLVPQASRFGFAVPVLGDCQMPGLVPACGQYLPDRGVGRVGYGEVGSFGPTVSWEIEGSAGVAH